MQITFDLHGMEPASSIWRMNCNKKTTEGIVSIHDFEIYSSHLVRLELIIILKGKLKPQYKNVK